MTAQLARIQTAITSIRTLANKAGTAIWDLLVVAVAVGAIGILAVPIGHHVYGWWHSTIAAWAAPAPAKAIAKGSVAR